MDKGCYTVIGGWGDVDVGDFFPSDGEGLVWGYLEGAGLEFEGGVGGEGLVPVNEDGVGGDGEDAEVLEGEVWGLGIEGVEGFKEEGVLG